MLMTNTTEEALHNSLESIWRGNFLKADDDEDKWQDNDPWGTDVRGIDNFLAQTAAPDPDHEAPPGETALHSYACATHIALAKVAALRGDHASVHAHLDSAMSHFTHCHGALCAAAAD
jgi:hypothetical protein